MCVFTPYVFLSINVIVFFDVKNHIAKYLDFFVNNPTFWFFKNFSFIFRCVDFILFNFVIFFIFPFLLLSNEKCSVLLTRKLYQFKKSVMPCFTTKSTTLYMNNWVCSLVIWINGIGSNPEYIYNPVYLCRVHTMCVQISFASLLRVI